MTNMNALAAVVFVFIMVGSIGWLLQEVPSLLKKKFFNKPLENNQPTIKVGMYYKP